MSDLADRPKDDYIRIMPLGGLDTFGMNCCLVECNGEFLMFDCGLSFPDAQSFGLDYILPDWSWVLDNLDRLSGVVLTHGHEDHIGGLPFLLPDIDVPVYTGRMTQAMVERKLDDQGVRTDASFVSVEPGEVVEIGPFDLEFIHVNHSAPNAMSVAIGTPLGKLVFTGDWKLDQTPIGEAPLDLQTFARLGAEREVIALIGDSTNAEVPGLSRSERHVQRELAQVVEHAPGRVIIAMFSSNIPRLRGLFELAREFGRKVVLLGRSLQQNYGLARETGFLELNGPDLLISADDVDSYPPEKLLIVTTGSQAEPRASLPRMAYGDHHQVQLDPSDIVVISARVIPGNESGINQMINALVQKVARVITSEDANIHGSGHAQREELRLLMNLTRPEYVVPVHGEFRMRKAHAEMALETGFGSILINDGDVLEFGERGYEIVGRIPVGRVAVDGSVMGDLDHVQIRDRRKLAATGIIVAHTVLDRSNGEIVNGPDLLHRGFLAGEPESELLLDEAADYARAAIDDLPPQARTDLSEVQEALRTSIRRFFRRRIDRKPVVVPVVHEL